jgi:cation transport ATPase
VTAVVFDKTGTLTEGRPTLVNLSMCLRAAAAAAGARAPLCTAHVLALLAAAEAGSAHPLARALVDGARALAPALPVWDVEPGALEDTPGAGISATVVVPRAAWDALAAGGGAASTAAAGE